MEAMKMKMKTGIALLLLICLLLSMVACASSDPEDNEKNVRELTIVVTADNISQLEDYPYLKKVDLTGST
jgi:predicted component of type VI protein secretion system